MDPHIYWSFEPDIYIFQIENLKIKINYVKTKIDKQFKFAQEVDTSVEYGETKLRIERVNELLRKFIETENKMLEKAIAIQSDLPVPKLSYHALLFHPLMEITGNDNRSMTYMYITTIHENTTLSTGQKFQYLKGPLEKETSTLVRHSLINESNYLEAFQRLEYLLCHLPSR